MKQCSVFLTCRSIKGLRSKGASRGHLQGELLTTPHFGGGRPWSHKGGLIEHSVL